MDDKTLEEMVAIRVNVAEIAQAVAILAQEINILNPGLNLSKTIESMSNIIKKTYRN